MIDSGYTQVDLYSYYLERISYYLSNGKKKAAQGEAFSWLQEYVNTLCISVPWNWKIAKKQIAKHFFGKIPSIQIHFGDDIEEGVSFILLHPNQNVRCSYHKFDTACHSESRRINKDSLEWLIRIKQGMTIKDIIDIFTETSTPTTTCFRRFSLEYNESVAYEMGNGQAMYVFETERGKHDVAGMNFDKNSWNVKNANDQKLTNHLASLVKIHDQELNIKTQCICYNLGIPYITVEGYYDIGSPSEPPKIVDIDLPFDRAFF